MGFLGFSLIEQGMVSDQLRLWGSINLPGENYLGAPAFWGTQKRVFWARLTFNGGTLPHTVTKPRMLYGSAAVMRSLGKHRSIIYQRKWLQLPCHWGRAQLSSWWQFGSFCTLPCVLSQFLVMHTALFGVHRGPTNSITPKPNQTTNKKVKLTLVWRNWEAGSMRPVSHRVHRALKNVSNFPEPNQRH